MASSVAPSLDQLPLEILHRISYYLDVPNILRIRRVSRFLEEVSHGREIWSDAYRNAEFVRPPGPFLSQSVRDLEDALITSCRVDRNLRGPHGGTSQMERSASKVCEIRYTGAHLHANLVFGRFLFIAFREEVRCYDLNVDAFDSNSGASIVHRAVGGTLRSFRCVSAFDVEGRPFACAVSSETTERMTQISIYLINVGEESEVTLDLLYQFGRSVLDIQAVDLGPRVIAIQCLGPNHDDFIALDVHTRTKLTPLIHVPWHSETARLPELSALEDLTSPISISTSTHLLFATSFYTSCDGWSTFLQAFPLLPSHDRSHPSAFISPSHSGCIPGINMCDSVLLRDAVLDPSTQDTLITIRVHAYETSRPRSSVSRYGVLRLSSTIPSRGRDAEAGTVAFQLLGPLGRLSLIPFLHPSFNGTGRLFYTHEPGRCILSALDYNLTADGSDVGHSETKVVEYPSILTFPPPRTLLDYDPYSGRICLRFSMAKYSVIEIFDLAVYGGRTRPH